MFVNFFVMGNRGTCAVGCVRASVAKICGEGTIRCVRDLLEYSCEILTRQRRRGGAALSIFVEHAAAPLFSHVFILEGDGAFALIHVGRY